MREMSICCISEIDKTMRVKPISEATLLTVKIPQYPSTKGVMSVALMDTFFDQKAINGSRIFYIHQALMDMQWDI